MVNDRSAGTRTLFLFGEDHLDRVAIKNNILDAYTLCNLGIIGGVAVEEGREELAAMTAEQIQDESQGYWEEYGNAEAIVDAMIAGLGPKDSVPFGVAVKLLCPAVPMQSVENPALRQQAGQLETHYKHVRLGQFREASRQELAAQLGVGVVDLTDTQREQANQQAEERCRLAFRNEPVNQQRDSAFVANTVAFWNQVGPDLAMIINAGRSHVARIAPAHLPDDVRFIHIE